MADVGFNSVGLVVGIPLCGRDTSPKWGVTLATQNYPLNTRVTHCVTEGKEVGEARNQIVEYALKNKATYVWFLDDDVLPPAFAVQRLGYALDNEPPDSKTKVCAGVYFSKQEPSTPVIYKENGVGAHWHWKLNDVVEVESAGTGCMLIRTEVFEALEPPYFKTVEEYVNVGDNVGAVKTTDDIYFCEKVRKAGFRIIAHCGVLCAHYDIKTQKFFTIPQDSYPYKEAMKDEAEKVAQSESSLPA